MKDRIRIFEVSLRDGLQSEGQYVRTDDKLRYLSQLVASGIKHIELTSFARPDRIPALADADALAQHVGLYPDVAFWALVPNKRGLDRALVHSDLSISTVVSASDRHNRNNLNRSTEETLRAVLSMIEQARGHGRGTRTYLSTAFGCPYEGEVSEARVCELVAQLAQAGVDEVVLSDTIGVATPTQVVSLVERVVQMGVPVDRIALHLHDTRGMAVANCYAAYGVGVRRFDSSVSGIGGCPYAPGATGNVATEDLVYLFHSLGASSGVMIDAAAEAGMMMAQILGRALPGRYHTFWASGCSKERVKR